MTITVSTYNIHACVGMDGRFEPERIIAVLREINADVVALQHEFPCFRPITPTVLGCNSKYSPISRWLYPPVAYASLIASFPKPIIPFGRHLLDTSKSFVITATQPKSRKK
jgi:hypothetical protein